MTNRVGVRITSIFFIEMGSDIFLVTLALPHMFSRKDVTKEKIYSGQPGF